MEKKKKTGRIVFISILCFVAFLLLGSLVFVEVSIVTLNSSLEEKQTDVVEAFEARSKAVNELVAIIKSKMDLETKSFSTLAEAEKALKAATDIKSLSEANLKVDAAIDNLVYVMADKYPYLESPEVLDIESDIDSARNRIVMESTDFNDVANEYNFAVRNFPGNLLSSIFSHQTTETLKIVDYKSLALIGG